jgi:thiamine-phosphate pyrophosphorylase
VKADFDLYVVTDRQQTGGRALQDVVAAALSGGARAFQLREKDLPPRELYPLAQELRQLTRQHGARLLINDRIDVALAVDADGVHLTTTSLPPRVARRLLGEDRLIGVSTHNLGEVRRATTEGADFLVFGPVFYTPSKAPYGEPVGLEALRAARAVATCPILAIGGVNRSNLAHVMQAGADGIAVISAIISAPDPAAASRALLATLQPWRRPRTAGLPQAPSQGAAEPSRIGRSVAE